MPFFFSLTWGLVLKKRTLYSAAVAWGGRSRERGSLSWCAWDRKRNRNNDDNCVQSPRLYLSVFPHLYIFNSSEPHERDRQCDCMGNVRTYVLLSLP